MINLIGFPGCGTTSYYRYLVNKDFEVKYWDGWMFSETDRKYAGGVHLISMRDEKDIIIKNLKRGRYRVLYVQIKFREIFWRKAGAKIIYLEDLEKIEDFPHLNNFQENKTAMLSEKKKQDKITKEKWDLRYG